MGERTYYDFRSGDLNTLYKIGIYQVGGGAYWENISNKPADMSIGAGIIEVKPGSSSLWRVQLIYLQTSEVWFRCCYFNDTIHNTQWVKLNN